MVEQKISKALKFEPLKDFYLLIILCIIEFHANGNWGCNVPNLPQFHTSHALRNTSELYEELHI